ncbi:MAG: SAM-dependent methyltransferase [Bacteroidales bacterium]|nr:SAM-dependent methyltransferase [Bacteroidales bacterium]
MDKGKLILFPVGIGAESLDCSLPLTNMQLLTTCRTFIVEEVRTARRFLKHAVYPHPIDDTTFLILNEHTPTESIGHYLDAALQGQNIGLLSEAGLPCIADPGALATRMAHHMGIEVVPLVGPSSLMLALMASGMNGQNFAFNGYLPIDRSKRAVSIRHFEERMLRDKQTQIFIEAPYRNNQLLDALCTTLRSSTLICVAADLTLPTQTIITLSTSQWAKRRKEVNLHKRNTVFLIGQ